MGQYTIQLHRDAKQTLKGLDADTRKRVEDTLTEVSHSRQPTNHAKCEVLSNNHKEVLYKIRVGEYRAIAQLDRPNLLILKLGQRNGMYQDVDDIYAEL